MKLLRQSIKWVMLICGLLTCTMFYAVIAPQWAMQSYFGQTLEGPLAELIVRNWGALIGLMGVLLIYGALREQARTIALLVAGTSKLIFIGLVFSVGQPFLRFQVGISAAVDTVMVVLFAAYLLQGLQKTRSELAMG
jgi:hypothetical protein